MWWNASSFLRTEIVKFYIHAMTGIRTIPMLERYTLSKHSWVENLTEGPVWAERDLRYGDPGSSHTLKIESSDFLMTT
jgi:hypothetical protein